jgi:hypothetical protein
MKVEALLQMGPPELVLQALTERCIFLRIDGRYYAARWDGFPVETAKGERNSGVDGVWWLWELVHGSPEYCIPADFSRCTCPSEHRPCKHLLAMRFRPDLSSAK